jgi:hypothetical protein
MAASQNQRIIPLEDGWNDVKKVDEISFAWTKMISLYSLYRYPRRRATEPAFEFSSHHDRLSLLLGD